MKTAEEWANETAFQFDKMPTYSELVPVIKQIQEDAQKELKQELDECQRALDGIAGDYKEHGL